MRFSQRIGKVPVKVEMQREAMDDALRNGLWNVFLEFCVEPMAGRTLDPLRAFYRGLWGQFLKRQLDTLPSGSTAVHAEMRQWFFTCEWYQVYDILEFASGALLERVLFKHACNCVLARELSAYRFVGDVLTPITDTTEAEEIKAAIQAAADRRLVGVTTHLKEALSKLSDRKSPDYRNSVKESISAVEAICRVLSGDPRAELGAALKVIEQRVGLHGSLKKGFMALYGYTSDEGGIRHAMLDESTVDFADAKFMLVACSAFVNYVLLKAAKAGIKLDAG